MSLARLINMHHRAGGYHSSRILFFDPCGTWQAALSSSQKDSLVMRIGSFQLPPAVSAEFKGRGSAQPPVIPLFCNVWEGAQPRCRTDT